MSEINAVYYMWKREMIRFFRSKSRVIGSLGMPVFMLAILGTGLNAAINIPGMEGNYVTFITPGILSMVLLFASVFAGVIVIVDRQFGFLKETLVAPVSRTSIVIGKALGGATAAVLQGVIILGIAVLLGVNIALGNLLLAFPVMFLISFGFVALGIAIASVMEDMHGFQLIMNFMIMPMFFLSGALFPLDTAPEIIRYVSYVDPLTYEVESLRYLLIGSSEMALAVSIGILVLFSALCTFVAAYLFGRIES